MAKNKRTQGKKHHPRKNRITQTKATRNQRDTVFRMLFRDKKHLLSLYNALNQTSYTDPDALEIVTLENAIYMNMKNDLAFLLADQLNLYEHQSTYNPNIPLRDLFYIAKELETLVDTKQLYHSRLVTIPTPRFFVFYNGTAEQPEKQILRLSDAFEYPMEQPELELTVTMLNINLGKNQELLEACETLNEYTLYVTKVRNYMKTHSLTDAVMLAVDECIKENILREFLLKNKKEAMAVSIFEYDEEATLQYIRECEYDEGVKAGMEAGMEAGKAAGKAEDIIDLLQEKGIVPNALKEIIKAQTDIPILRSWLKFAVNAKDVEEFRKLISKEEL